MVSVIDASSVEMATWVVPAARRCAVGTVFQELDRSARSQERRACEPKDCCGT